jgi:hypothetical protein
MPILVNSSRAIALTAGFGPVVDCEGEGEFRAGVCQVEDAVDFETGESGRC